MPFEPSAEILRATSSPGLFAAAVTRGRRNRWRMARHLAYIDQAVVALIHEAQTAVSPPILVIEAPPRHGKSELISKYLPVWYLGTFPDRKVIVTGYGDDFVSEWGTAARDLMREHGEQYFGLTVRKDVSASSHWELDQFGGSMRTAGFQGQITGKGAHLLIVDDPIKSAADAVSELKRDKNWRAWENDIETRFEQCGCAIVIATRWHEDDLSGRLLRRIAQGQGESIRRIHLPALAEGDDPLGRQPGEPLWPWRFSKARLEKIRDSGSAARWLSLFQQNPSEHEGAEWPTDYFGDHLWEGKWPEAERFHMTAMAVDPSKGRAGGDYGAIVFGGVADGLLWVEAAVERMPLEFLVGRAIDMAIARQPAVVTIEGNAWQDLAMGGEINRQCAARNLAPLPIRFVENRDNKQDRIRRLGPYFQQRRIRFRNNEGSRRLVQQLREFPLAEHDDGPDALEMLIRTFQHLQSEAMRHEGEIERAQA